MVIAAVRAASTLRLDDELLEEEDASGDDAELTDTRKALMRRVNIAASEVDSVLRLIQTQLDMSLRRALGPTDESG